MANMATSANRLTTFIFIGHYKHALILCILAAAGLRLISGKTLFWGLALIIICMLSYIGAVFMKNHKLLSLPYNPARGGGVSLTVFNGLCLANIKRLKNLIAYPPFFHAPVTPNAAYCINDSVEYGYALTTLIAADMPIAGCREISGSIMACIFFAVLIFSVLVLTHRLVYRRRQYYLLRKTDTLTGLNNFHSMLKLGQKILAAKKSLALIVVDLDRFKQINDTFGHAAGNKILIQLARLLQDIAHQYNGFVGRLGGDEFIILLENQAPEVIAALGTDIHAGLGGKLISVDPDLDAIKLSVSIGEAYSTPENPLTMDELLLEADKQLHFNRYQMRQAQVQLGASMMYRSMAGGRELLNVLAEKDLYTFVHSRYTALYAQKLGAHLKLSRQVLDDLHMAGWLHDIGKITISNDILRKTAALTNQEYAIIKTHPQKGADILAGSGFSDVVTNCVLYHHERWDGQGYPTGTSGENIPLEARIMQIADAFSAMTLKRVYRSTPSTDSALLEIEKNLGGQFDPVLAQKFIKLMTEEINHGQIS